MQRHRRPSNWPRPSPNSCGSTFVSRRRDAAYIGADYAELTAALEEFVLRGGKRLRPAFAYWGWRAVAPDGTTSRTPTYCGCSPRSNCCTRAHSCTTTSSTPRPPAAGCRPCTGSSPSGTAGTTGTARPSSSGCRRRSCSAIWRWSGPTTSLPSAELRVDAHRRVQRVWADIRTEVLGGQYLDIVAESSGAETVASAMTVNTYKTASYTVSRPLQLGAAAAADRPEVLADLPRDGHRAWAWRSNCATTCSASSATLR